MPRLEIHHADGNITYADLSEAKPVMVGSGPKCDVVVDGPEVKRIHCRIVWREDRWRVEVAADAGGVQLGDKTVKAGTIRFGDTLGIGDCRLYFDAAEGEARPESHDHSPLAAALDDTSSVAAEPAAEEWAPVSSRDHGPHGSRDQRGAVRKAWDKFRLKAKEQVQGEIDRRPGEERLLSSPLVRWMIGVVAVLAVAGTYFYLDFREREIVKEFDKAQKNMDGQVWETAIKLYGEFLEKHPNHGLASNARVQRALCEVQGTSAPGVQLDNLKKLIREQGKEPAYPPIMPKLGEIAVSIAQRLAENARDRADTAAFDKTMAALDVLSADLSGVKPPEDARTKLENTIDQAREAIKKFTDRTGTLQVLDESLNAGNPFALYLARERYVQKYPEAVDPKTYDDKDDDIRDRMTKAQRADVERVRYEALHRDPPAQVAAEAVQATTLLMDRTGPDPGEVKDAKFVLAGGVCSAHDVASGKLLWNRVVGLDAHTLPVPVPGGQEPTVLVTDARRDELLAVRTLTGKLVWRQPLGEPLDAAPLIHRGMIYQVGGKGSLFVLNAATGRLEGRLQFGTQRLTATPAADDTGQHLYVLGEQSVVYVITLENPPKCMGLCYLAHRPDSVLAAPLRVGRYLVVCENVSTETCQLRVLLISPDGAVLEDLQRPQPPLIGWVHHVPSVWSNRMLVATDIDTVEIFAAGAPEKAEGFSKVIAAAAPATGGPRGHAYPLGYSETDLLVASNSLRHYEFSAEKVQLTAKDVELQVPGAASQPIQRHPPTGRAGALFVARRVPNSAAVLFTALDAATHKTRWEVLLGNGLVSLLQADAAGNEVLALTRGGHAFRISAANLKSGGVIEKSVRPIPVGVDLSGDVDPVVLRDRSAIFAPTGEPNRLFVVEPGAEPKGRPVELLAPLQAPVTAFGEGFVAPCTDGRIYLISPVTGKTLSEPFQPPLEAGQPPPWRGVALTDKGSIIAVDSRGNVYQLELRKESPPNLAARGQTTMAKPIRSRIAAVRNVVCCVDEENRLHTIDAEALTPIADAPLPAPASVGPVAAGNHIFVAAGTAELFCVNAEGQVAWRQPLNGAMLAGTPLVKGDVAYLALRNGVVQALRLVDGSPVWTPPLDTEKSLAGGVVAVGELLVVAGDDGSVNVLKPPAPAK